MTLWARNRIEELLQLSDMLKGLAAGLAGGLVASWTMNQFQAVWTKTAEVLEKSHGVQSMQLSEGKRADFLEQKKENQDVWLVADETAVPLLKLSNPPTEYPGSTPVYALAAHLVFGLTAELVRRNLRRAMLD